jgi:hypothetical protein
LRLKSLALGIKSQAFSDVFDHVLAHLKRKYALLIVDNCEHVAAETSGLIEAILQTSPAVTVLATGRENLRMTGEHIYRLGSLDLPDRDDMSADDALNFSAISLFVAVISRRLLRCAEVRQVALRTRARVGGGGVVRESRARDRDAREGWCIALTHPRACWGVGTRARVRNRRAREWWCIARFVTVLY